MADSKSVDIDELLNIIGFGRMQFLIFFACMFQVMYIANEQFSISLTVVAASCDINVDEHRMGWLVAVGFSGQVLTSLFMGHTADEIGRRRLLLITSMMTMAASFISSMMPDFYSFTVIRFFVGCFSTGSGMAALTYMSEFTAIQLRPKVINFMFYSNGISLMYSAAFAMLLNPMNLRWPIKDGYDLTSWRLQMWAVIVPGIVSCMLFIALPESPKYYLSIGKPVEAYEALDKCYRYNKGANTSLASRGITAVSQNVLRPSTEGKNFFAQIWYGTKALFEPPNLRHMVNLIIIMFLLFATGVGLTVWIPRILEMGKKIQKQVTLCELIRLSSAIKTNSTSIDTNPKCHLSSETLKASMILGACGLCFSILVSILIFWLNRKIILLVCSIIAILAGLALNFVKLEPLVIACCICLSVPPLCSLRLALTVVIDVIPTHLRSKAVSLSFMSGRTGVLLVGLYVGYMVQEHCYIAFNTFVVLLLLSIVFIAFLPMNPNAGSRIQEQVIDT